METFICHFIFRNSRPTNRSKFEPFSGLFSSYLSIYLLDDFPPSMPLLESKLTLLHITKYCTPPPHTKAATNHLLFRKLGLLPVSCYRPEASVFKEGR